MGSVVRFADDVTIRTPPKMARRAFLEKQRRKRAAAQPPPPPPLQDETSEPTPSPFESLAMQLAELRVQVEELRQSRIAEESRHLNEPESSIRQKLEELERVLEDKRRLETELAECMQAEARTHATLCLELEAVRCEEARLCRAMTKRTMMLMTAAAARPSFSSSSSAVARHRCLQ